MTAEEQIAAIVDEEKCTGCGMCEDACPQEAIAVDDVARVNADPCTECGVCATVFHTGGKPEVGRAFTDAQRGR